MFNFHSVIISPRGIFLKGKPNLKSNRDNKDAKSRQRVSSREEEARMRRIVLQLGKNRRESARLIGLSELASLRCESVDV